jgi:hypothetical protein
LASGVSAPRSNPSTIGLSSTSRSLTLFAMAR